MLGQQATAECLAPADDKNARTHMQAHSYFKQPSTEAITVRLSTCLLEVATAVGLLAGGQSYSPDVHTGRDQQDQQSHRRTSDADAGHHQERDQGWGSQSRPHPNFNRGKPPKVKAYVVRNRGQVQYCVEIVGVAVLTCELPPVLRLSLNDWRILVESAAANEQ